jgi:hypothetical protein
VRESRAFDERPGRFDQLPQSAQASLERVKGIEPSS